MPAPTVQEINDAKTDLDDLEQIVNGDATTTVTTRLGGDKPSVSKALSDASAFRSVADYTALAALLTAGTVPVGAVVTVLNPSGPPFEVKQGVATDDLGVIITQNRGTTTAGQFYAERIFSGPAIATWFGIAGDGTEENSAIISFHDYLLSSGKNGHFPAGNYDVGNSNWPFRNPEIPPTSFRSFVGMIFTGDGFGKTIFRTTSNDGADVLNLNGV
jgi:hypothetical protein